MRSPIKARDVQPIMDRPHAEWIGLIDAIDRFSKTQLWADMRAILAADEQAACEDLDRCRPGNVPSHADLASMLGARFAYGNAMMVLDRLRDYAKTAAKQPIRS